jgi:protocatechuate 3,4-dioxygenase alpha subunit
VLALLPEPLRERLLAVPHGDENGMRIFRFDLRLRGGPDEETPFFED